MNLSYSEGRTQFKNRKKKDETKIFNSKMKLKIYIDIQNFIK